MTACQTKGPKDALRSNNVPLRYHSGKSHRHADCRLDIVAENCPRNVYWTAISAASQVTRLNKNKMLKQQDTSQMVLVIMRRNV